MIDDPAVDPTRPLLQTSGTYTAEVMQGIHTKAETGLYEIRGYGTLRQRRWATFDDLTFLPCGLTRIPLEGYREKCSTKTVLGSRFAKRPIELEIPIMITGMSWGALSYNAKVALAKARGEGGHVQYHRRWRPLPGGAGVCQGLRVRSASLALRNQRARYARGERHRIDHRPGREAGHRRPAAGLEDFRDHRSPARSARRRRPAQSGPAP